MFREVYKQANEEIKGDKLIIEKAFQKAAAPVKKKTPVFRYSFVGTCAAAVLIFGVVFMNSELFTDKGFVLENMPTENETVNEAVIVCDEPVVFSRSETPDENSVGEETVLSNTKPKTANTEKKAKNEVVNNTATTQESEINVASELAEEGVAAWSMNRAEIDDDSDFSDDALAEDATEPEKFMFKRPSTGGGSEGEPDEAEADGVNEEIPAFSYMYDLSVWEERSIVKEGFVNTDISPVTNSEEAVKRAKRELNEYIVTSVSYDPVENMWRVEFQKCGPDGYDYIYLYLNSDGITQMIVYPGYYFGE